MQTIQTTFMVQLKVDGEWHYYSTHEYSSQDAAAKLAGEIYGGAIETRIVTVTRTVDAEPMTVLIDTDEGPTRWAL